MESAAAELRRLEQQLEAVQKRERSGRALVAESAHSGDALDRAAGVEEVSIAGRVAARLLPCIKNAEQAIADRRSEYFSKRIERQQVEVLIKEAEIREAAETERKTQQALDDWCLGRMRHGEGGGHDRTTEESVFSLTQQDDSSYLKTL
jgi:hypothetical protein